jgi:hypothetical protein
VGDTEDGGHCYNVSFVVAVRKGEIRDERYGAAVDALALIFRFMVSIGLWMYMLLQRMVMDRDCRYVLVDRYGRY